ncbi:C-Maf-inducing protein-like isoform X1 [Osmia bicornis bicornis]|uniref:C-Maf-inducing protein-like isoform X1 n=2 Tax=Osmia bicornis bicornis TaxID=1437191 RepID=UPI0010F46A2F|nr:C-Maf-inducing protein-like isoform X1 [Osmia bicornis bicornis]XP_029043589.1 C-Maf-inducing protein-like isoform X1 [Osmia bicornis bicornis]XP_029043590.1 C-Maf-inducing protein-like isoform X1 [Osmia bicornis bicornis]XP_046144176.1 C-Maf-inducing protein-like isoform X1 [Osmia bicornis bicornis]XP_046144177.1 C-Maf-inducing protein-like isoform X1 [Osmia bicornis bicornis]
MFCFQTPFTRASRVLVSPLSSSKGKTTSMSMILPMSKSSSGSKCDRRGSEATSEDSGSSIRYIDQEPSISASSSTDTLPDIKADYLDPESLSPGPDSLTAPAAIVPNGVDEEKLLEEDKDENCRSSSPAKASPKKRFYSNRRCRKLLLRLRSNESSSSSNKEACSAASHSPASDSIETESPESSRDRENEYKTDDANHLTKSSPSVLIDSVEPEEALKSCRATSENDISSLQNTFSESEKENIYQETETETEEGSSLPLSPAGPSATGLSSSTVPYYNFLCVNGGAMRQEMTSTSSPQLSSGSNLRSSTESTPADVCSSEKSSRMDTLKPEGLESQFSLPAARSCPNLERQSAGCSPISGSSSSSLSPGPVGPRFKPVEEGDIQVCFLNHTKTLVRKILSSKFLRRWETHHLYLNDTCISSKTPTGFLQQPIPYSNMSDIRKYAVARWDPTYKNCLSIVLSDSSILLQANNAYTRDQWYHSILWKRSIFKYQHLVSLSTREEVIIKELKSMVDFALWTSLQDERVTAAPLEAVAKLLEDSVTEDSERKLEKSGEEITRYQNDRKQWAEAVLSVVSPLLDKVALPACLAKVLAKLAQHHPQSPLVSAISPAITRCLKHTVDFGKSPDMRRLLQVFIAALYAGVGGEQVIREYVASVHGPGSDCPHPRVLPNLVSVCVAAIFHRFEVANCSLSEQDKSTTLPPLDCYLLVLNVASEYADWRPGFGALLQPVPFPEEALAIKEVQQSILMCVIKRLAKDSRCIVHRVLLPVREPRPGWIHIAAPSSPACPDQGELFGEMLTTLLACCCRRKRFITSIMKQARDDCILLAVRGCEAAQEALCLMLEWYLLPNEEARLQIVNALESTTSGKNRYAALCQRQRNLQELQQKGGPRKLTLPVRATDADVALLLGGRALGNLECLSLAFTSVTSACAEQLIKLPALRYLNLWATQFGDAGLQMISEHLQKLQVLNLCETPVSDKGISTLVSLTSLRKLNLNSTKLSVQTFESLKKCLPALQEFDVRYTEAW